MILGRSKALWLAFIIAALNAGVGILHWQLDLSQLGLLNMFAVAALGILANESDPTTAGTFALTTKAPTGTASGGSRAAGGS